MEVSVQALFIGEVADASETSREAGFLELFKRGRWQLERGRRICNPETSTPTPLVRRAPHSQYCHEFDSAVGMFDWSLNMKSSLCTGGQPAWEDFWQRRRIIVASSAMSTAFFWDVLKVVTKI